MADNNNHSTNDAATLDTQLGTGGFIKRLGEEVRHSPSPKSLSITGYWGAGKTSALAQLYYELTNREPVGFSTQKHQDNRPKPTDITGIWFEAWRYQNEPVPIVALLHCIKNHFSTTDKFIDRAGKLVKVSMLGALSVFDGVIKTATGVSGLDKLQAVGEKFEKDNLLTRLASDQINDALEKAINVILNEGEQNSYSDKKKLVIFIDDLDRCEPKAAEKLLEGIKLYLNIANCTVVMAIDQKQIEAILSKKVKDELGVEDGGFYGVEYLEKLCQDTHRLPIPNKKQRNDFLLWQLRQLLTISDFVELNSVLTTFDCLPANPRRLKMLANRMSSIYRHTAGQKNHLLEVNEFEENTAVYDLAVLVVSVFSVSYQRIYERLEMSAYL
jgi:predicted KAP-like P-loop ATPase